VEAVTNRKKNRIDLNWGTPHISPIAGAVLMQKPQIFKL